MTNQDYEYKGMLAEYWDLLRGDISTWEDRPFFRDAILKSGQPALDVGCGTGRLLLDYLADGIDIDGVDNSPEMLEICRRKAEEQGLHPALYCAQMEALELPRKYRTIIVPSSSFQLLTDEEGAALALDLFWQHLEPGGTLVMPFMLLWSGQVEPGVTTVEEDWHASREMAREDGATVQRFSRSTYDLATQLESTEDRYEVKRDGQVVAEASYSRSPATRWYTQAQGVALYEKAGFTGVRLVSDFTDQPAKPDDYIFCVFGTKPA